jgi:hypothetical protein
MGMMKGIVLVASAATSAGCTGDHYGRVWITNAVAGQPGHVLAEFGGFVPVSASRNPAYGACFGTTRSFVDRFASAGTLELSGSGDPLQLVPDATGTYRATASAAWDPGTSLTITASGGAVPAFTDQLFPPPPFVYDQTSAELAAAIAGDNDVVLTWNPTSALHVWVGVTAGDAELSCSFRGDDGTGTIPGAALATLPASRTISSVASNSDQLQLGDWWVDVIAQSRAQLADGSTL